VFLVLRNVAFTLQEGASMSPLVGIIGTTGIEKENLFSANKCEMVNTRYGAVPVFIGRVAHTEVAFLSRSGHRHPLEPHEVNYRANILALRQLGVRCVVGSSVVGSLSLELPPGSLVLLDQFLDFTKQRPRTLFDDYGFAFTDMTNPYCEHIREEILRSASLCDISLQTEGCYVGVDGPRFETAAEVRMYAQLGGHVIGHTGVTETIMAREAGLCYANIALVTNLAAGISPRPVSNVDITEVRRHHAEKVEALIEKTIIHLSEYRAWTCSCPHVPVDLQLPSWSPPYQQQ
jgi:5'-methylthioadenosine phosphorylase